MLKQPGNICSALCDALVCVPEISSAEIHQAGRRVGFRLSNLLKPSGEGRPMATSRVVKPSKHTLLAT